MKNLTNGFTVKYKSGIYEYSKDTKTNIVYVKANSALEAAQEVMLSLELNPSDIVEINTSLQSIEQ